MLDIDLICPVQFIEGRNKFAEPDKTSDVKPNAYVEYIPKVSHSIARIDVCINWPVSNEDHDNKIVIYADYLDHPTDIVLTEGSIWFMANEPPSKGWRTIEITKPVVLIAHKRYWIQFSDKENKFSFCAASKGDHIITKVKSNNKWETVDSSLMLRFYGRILPIALIHQP